MPRYITTRRAFKIPALLAILLLVSVVSGPLNAASQPAQKPLTNEDVLTMVQAGLPPDVVIEKIKASKTAFDTSTEGLVALKKAGVGGDIIRIMVNPAAAAKSGAGSASPFVDTNAPAPCQVPPNGQAPWLSGTSPAMWTLNPDKGERTEITYERGTIAHVGFAGFGSRLLVLHPIRATARVKTQAQFLSCLNPTEAPLVHFSLDDKSNERNTSVGRTTPFNVSFNISEEDLVPTKFEKTPEGYYRITPESALKAGEYGFVPQGSIGFFSAGERVYTFGVD
jgi:hypothetical protein